MYEIQRREGCVRNRIEVLTEHGEHKMKAWAKVLTMHFEKVQNLINKMQNFLRITGTFLKINTTIHSIINI